MITIHGEGVSDGVAAGRLRFLRRAELAIPRAAVVDAEAEWRRFKDAQARAGEQLAALAETARMAAGDEAALLLETHRMMTEDLDYEAAVAEGVRRGLNAEAVVADVRDRFAAMFAGMDDPYMRSRSADVKDVSDRILVILTGTARHGVESDGPVILAADDLAPSETVQLDRDKVLGFITEGGSASSHTAILARTMGIPAIIGAGGALRPEHEGREIIVDGGAGVAVLDPDAPTRERLLEKRASQECRRAALRAIRGEESVTKDGRAVRISCNINGVQDLRAVLDNGGDGVGLFRSEFLYLGRDTLPSEEEQFEAYKAVLTAMGDRGAVIRTLDAGGDKRVAALEPSAGRGLRVCLARPEVFCVQLRALYRASAFGKLRVMFPMLTSVRELREAKALCEQVRRELGAAPVPLGAVIETPAAALVSDRLAEEADFFSCGTNDLTQYTLARDRQDGGRFDPYHPAVLRLLRLAADNAHKNGIPVGVCGDLAADPRMTETFLALGFDELSVPPRAVLPLRRRVREIDVLPARERVLKALEDV